jgi:purine-binding chemotaxis protein CheW
MKNQKPCVLFLLCKEHFGIDVDNVLRVINLEKLMKVPKAPSFIAGAISLEGNVIPVVDLAKKIDLGETTITKATKVIILEVNHSDEDTMQVGVMIDEVLDVIALDDSKFIPPALESMGFDTQTLDGMYKIEEEFYMILSANKIFEKELASII